MLQVAKDIKIDMIYILGDYADFYAVSSHSKDPRVGTMLEKEVKDVIAGLDELDSPGHESRRHRIGKQFLFNV